mgnify:CR=1 FL=1
MKTKTSIYHRTFAFAYILLVSVIFCGCCTKGKAKEKEVQIHTKASWGMDVYVKLIEVDSCEYIVSTNTEAISTIHKHNCKFCAERSKN